ncbi:dystrotelin [Elgaria multicarinata webbii]|uniref:dystrotelin n=1 Tax=Elgaria multicarinata webbii TaxID=159646 RepID=UPI002FCCC998
MDLDQQEALNAIQNSVYRTALKLRAVQSLCQLDLVDASLIQHILPNHQCRDEKQDPLTVKQLSKLLKELFGRARLEKPGQVAPKAHELTLSLLTAAFDRNGVGFIQPRSVAAALIALSGENLLTKYRAFFQLYATCAGRGSSRIIHITRNGVRKLLTDLLQILIVVGENRHLSNVEIATCSCFSGVLNSAVGEERFLAWLQSEPAVLLWLPTCYRLLATEMVTHQVKCKVCKSFPITGLRYRCLKCLNFDLCQVCFFTGQHRKPHKKSHPVMEQCVPVSAKDSTKLFFRTIRNNLLQGRCERKEALRRKALVVVGDAGLSTHSQALYLKKELNKWKSKVQLLHSAQEDRNRTLEAKLHELLASQENLRLEVQEMRLEIQNVPRAGKKPSKERNFQDGSGYLPLKPSHMKYSKCKSLDLPSACVERKGPFEPQAGLLSRKSGSPEITRRSELLQNSSPEVAHNESPSGRFVPITNPTGDLKPETNRNHLSSGIKITGLPCPIATEALLSERQMEEEEEEEELQQLMRKLKDALSFQVRPGQPSVLKEGLLSTAEHVCKSFSDLISHVTLLPTGKYKNHILALENTTLEPVEVNKKCLKMQPTLSTSSLMDLKIEI